MELSFQLNPFILYTIGVCFLAHIIFKVSQLFVSRHRQAVALKDFPGPAPHWLYGNIKEVLDDPDRELEIAQEWVNSFPNVAKFWLGPFRADVRVYHPDYIRSVMSGADPKDPLYRFMEPWLGDGLLLSKGRKWARNRRLLTPAFHYEILKAYVKLFNASSVVLLNKWQGLCGKGTASLEVFQHMSLLTLDNILKCAFSYRSECQLESEQNEYITCIFEVTSVVMDRFKNPLFFHDWLYHLSTSGRRFKKVLRIIHKFSKNIIAARKEALNISQNQNDRAQKRKYLDFLDILLKARDEDDVGMSDEEIQHEVDTFMFAGHDTTTSGLSWFFYNMANHPDIQERCREEINDVLGEESDVKWEHLPRLGYLDKCIKESLRVHPPVVGVRKMVEKDTALPDKRTIPAGTVILLDIYATHHNAEVWKNPSDYDPSRFDNENREGRSPFAFIPFSAGPRNCIGQNFTMMEMKVSAAQILRKFKFQIDKSVPAVIYKPELILRTKEGLKLNVTAL